MDLFTKNKEEKESNKSDLSDIKTSDISLEELEKRHNERLGTISKDGRGRKSKTQTIQDELTKDLYKPSVWQEVGSLPFNIRKAMTGDEIFDLNKDQKDALGSPLALLMKTLVEIDPKYIALIVFSINLGTIWTEKEILYSMKKKRLKNVKSSA